jgi:hypothetical protein
MKTNSRIIRALDMIETTLSAPGAWCKNNFTEHKTATVANALDAGTDLEAVPYDRFCVMGAAWKAETKHGLSVGRLRSVLEAALPKGFKHGNVEHFNDHRQTRKSDVIALVRRAKRAHLRALQASK